MDNFGTGSSSLTYLRKLPINDLKVDNTFVINIFKNGNDMKTLKGALAIGQSFDLNVIAEGMETNKHRDELKKLGYSLAQGYGIAKPMRASEVVNWLENWHKPDDWE